MHALWALIGGGPIPAALIARATDAGLPVITTYGMTETGSGVAAGAPSGNTMTLNVSRIGLRTIGSFNFTVGGNAQADPSRFDVDVTGG